MLFFEMVSTWSFAVACCLKLRFSGEGKGMDSYFGQSIIVYSCLFQHTLAA